MKTTMIIYLLSLLMLSASCTKEDTPEQDLSNLINGTFYGELHKIGNQEGKPYDYAFMVNLSTYMRYSPDEVLVNPIERGTSFRVKLSIIDQPDNGNVVIVGQPYYYGIAMDAYEQDAVLWGTLSGSGLYTFADSMLTYSVTYKYAPPNSDTITVTETFTGKQQ